MKQTFGILLLLLVTLTSRADLTNLTVSTSPGTVIPDANPVGITSTLTVSGMTGFTTNLTVALDITGGFTGDLYAYLISPTGTMVVLLNRPGMSSSASFGYSNSGFDVTLSASSSNIHTFEAGTYSLNGGGQLTGTWGTDSRAIDPMGAPSTFDAAAAGNTLLNLNGTSPNGVWTIFVADLSGGGQSTLVSWGLTVVTAPEPQTWTLLGGGLAALWAIGRKRFV